MNRSLPCLPTIHATRSVSPIPPQAATRTGWHRRLCAALLFSNLIVLPSHAAEAEPPTDLNATRTVVEGAGNSTPAGEGQQVRDYGGGGGFYQNDGPAALPYNLDAIPEPTPQAEPLHTYANRPYNVLGQSFTPMTDIAPFTQEGIGSWYGKQFHGQKASSGEVYDMFRFSAAHPTLPIPSYARVTNLENGRSVVVRINDRGPFLKSRIIDVSYIAAYRLGFHNAGSARLRVESLMAAGGGSQVARVQYVDGNLGNFVPTRFDAAPVELLGGAAHVAEAALAAPASLSAVRVAPATEPYGRTPMQAAPAPFTAALDEGASNGITADGVTLDRLYPPFQHDPPPSPNTPANEEPFRESNRVDTLLDNLQEESAPELAAPLPTFPSSPSVADASQPVVALAPALAPPPPPPPSAQHIPLEISTPRTGKSDVWLQLGAFSSRSTADAFIHRNQPSLKPLGTLVVEAGPKGLWRVRMGPFTNRAQAASARDRMVKMLSRPPVVVSGW